MARLLAIDYVLTLSRLKLWECRILLLANCQLLLSTPTEIQPMQDAVWRILGPEFVPDDIITLKQLGLTDFPKIISVKVQKSQLSALVANFRSLREKEKTINNATTQLKLSIPETVS